MAIMLVFIFIVFLKPKYCIAVFASVFWYAQVELEMNGQTYAHTNSHQSGAVVKLASATAFITSSFTQGSNPMAPGIPWSRISAETP